MSTTQGPQSGIEAQVFHGGRLIARRLKAHGVSRLFTLSGGHLFSIYDGCRTEGIEIVDVRHEQTAAFAAEGWSKITRSLGVCALTAGPGVTNGISALASAQANRSPMLALGGRAPAARWGQGSLQEIDHIPLVSTLCNLARTAESAEEIPQLVEQAIAAALGPRRGPAFLDFPLDHVFSEAPEPEDLAPASISALPVHQEQLEHAATLLRAAERPVLMAGTDLYWERAEQALLELVEELEIPVFLNGLARGCLPSDHRLCFSRARSAAFKQADVAVLVGAPLDFRLGFGAVFGTETKIVVLSAAEPDSSHPRAVDAVLAGAFDDALKQLRIAAQGRPTCRSKWCRQLREIETDLRNEEGPQLADTRAPLHPMRLYAELQAMLDRDAIIIGDGGDFVSYAGKVIESFEPGCWVDPGPFGCLGSGLGYALAAKLAHPHRQVVLLLGDGAFGFAGLEFDTLVRHGVNVVAVMGNNGIWALEKHPMEFVYGYSVAADLRPGTRYDRVVQDLGGHGELVQSPEELKAALERAFTSGLPSLVNVLTDPSVIYPRKANLA